MPHSVLNSFGQPIGAALPTWTPRRAPAPRELLGRWCRLDPLAATHTEGLYRALCVSAPDSLWTYMSIGPFRDLPTFGAAVSDLIEAGDAVSLAITRHGDADPTGLACYLRIDPANGCVEVGSIVLAPALQRTAAATEAMYLMARHVFDDLGYRRYEWKCDLLNAASLVAARRLGFRFEGVWRNALVYKGRNRDTAWFSITDADWQHLRPEFEAWLAAGNSSDGAQRRSLSAATARIRAELDAVV